MRPVSAGFAAAVRSSGQTRVGRATALDANLDVVAELDAVEGSVSIDADRRRSCSVRIANPDGRWTPSGPGDPLFPNGLLRLERGLLVEGNPELVSLGIFVIDRPAIDVRPAGSTLDVSGQDRVKLASKSRFTVPETYAAGTPIAEIVQTIAAAAGMGQTLYRLDDGGSVLGADRTFETNDDRWPAIAQLANDYALVAYIDADGYLVLERAVTPDTLPPSSFAFTRGADGVMLQITKGWNDDRLYNHVRVIGQSSDLPPVMAEARDLNPSSPAYNPIDGTGPIGDRLYEYSSPMIRSIEQAQDVADAMLLDVALVQEELTIPSVVHPALEVADAVDVVEDLSATADTYLIDTLTLPLASGAMTMTARKLRDLRALA